MLSSKLLEVGYCCFTYPRMNMWWSTGTTAIRAIRMWIPVSLENANIILVSDCINITISNYTNNLVKYTAPILIWIYHGQLISQSLIWLDCGNNYLWPRLVLATVRFSDRFDYSGSMKTRTWPVRSGFVQNGSLN